MIEISRSTTSSVNMNKTNHQRNGSITKKKPAKSTHVPTACINCKKAHLACDLSRPCKRCSALGKCDTCIDIKHKKRGRPKLTDSNKWQPTSSKLNTIPATSSVAGTATKTANNNFISLLPMTAPGLSACSFKLTNNNNNSTTTTGERSVVTPPTAKSEMMTIFLSMDLCCARVSDESIDYLNIHPNDVDHCSFYDLIHPDSSEALSRIHRLLLDNSHSNRVPQQQPISFTTTASSDLFLTSSAAQLFQIANGSQTLRETLKFKTTGKNMSCRFYLGGGFGADLFKPNTLDHLYMVCIASDLNHTTSASNIIQPPTLIQRQSDNNNLINALLFDQNNKQGLDSLLSSSSELISMYNTPTNGELVNHLCELMIAPPSTPPSMYNFNKEYYSSSSSDSSIEGNRLVSLGHETFLSNNTHCGIITPPEDTSFNTNALLLDSNTMFTLSSSLIKEEEWGYDNIYASS